MNVQMVPKEALDKIAGFPVGNLIDHKNVEVSLLGEHFEDARSFSHKDFWKAYRKATRAKG